MEPIGSYGTTWADQWDDGPDPYPTEPKKSGTGGAKAKYSKKVEAGLGKTKSAAVTGMKKAKVGATAGVDKKWYLDSGATHHVTGEQKNVQSAQPFSDKSSSAQSSQHALSGEVPLFPLDVQYALVTSSAPDVADSHTPVDSPASAQHDGGDGARTASPCSPLHVQFSRDFPLQQENTVLLPSDQQPHSSAEQTSASPAVVPDLCEEVPVIPSNAGISCDLSASDGHQKQGWYLQA
ncbi:hypothetical protein V6N13_075007 [Hibiscus sabdariffa]